MKSNTLSASNIEVRKRIKGPYNQEEVAYLKGHILGCLRILTDTGKKVNYEDLFFAIGKLPDTICAPEWEKHWNIIAKKIHLIYARTKRQKYFKEVISEQIRIGLFPTNQKDIEGLTGNFSKTIQDIIENPTL